MQFFLASLSQEPESETSFRTIAGAALCWDCFEDVSWNRGVKPLLQLQAITSRYHVSIFHSGEFLIQAWYGKTSLL